MASKRFYHEMPNMVDDDLDVYEYRLYGHYRRVIGNNGQYCTESVRELAEQCQMSVGKVSQARRDLETRGLIIVEDLPGPGGSIAGSRVSLVDVWGANSARYEEAGQAVSEDLATAQEAPSGDPVPCSPHEHPRSLHEHPRSPGERSINNQYESITNSTTRTHHHQTLRSQPRPPRGDDDGKAWSLIFGQVGKWNLQPYARDLLRNRAPEDALALVWLAGGRAAVNPAGYLVRMLIQGQEAARNARDLASIALEAGTCDQEEAERVRWRREAVALNAQYGFDS